jgi:hypothetical protein
VPETQQGRRTRSISDLRSGSLVCDGSCDEPRFCYTSFKRSPLVFLVCYATPILPTSRPFFYASKTTACVHSSRFLDLTFGEVQRQLKNIQFVLCISCILDNSRRIYATIGLICHVKWHFGTHIAWFIDVNPWGGITDLRILAHLYIVATNKNRFNKQSTALW